GNQTTNYYVGYYVRITSGTGANQIRRITASSYNGTIVVCTINSAWTIDPPNGSSAAIFGAQYAHLHWNEARTNFELIGTPNGDPTSTSGKTFLSLTASDLYLYGKFDSASRQSPELRFVNQNAEWHILQPEPNPTYSGVNPRYYYLPTWSGAVST